MITKRIAVAAGVLGLTAAALVATPASAATWTQNELSFVVGTGGAVTAHTKVTANTRTTAEYSICVRPASNVANGTNLDYPHWVGADFNPSQSYDYTKTFAPGTYTGGACVKDGTTWKSTLHGGMAGAAKTFTVGGTTPTPTPTPTPTATPTPTPTAPAGFTLQRATSFDTPAAAGTVNSVYSDYLDLTDNTHQYSPANASVSGGQLDINLTAGNGSTQGKGARFTLGGPNDRWGQQYGAYEITYEVTGASGHGAAFMIWPSDNVWSSGELDFPETGNFDSNQKLFHHPTPCDLTDGDAVPHCGSSVQADTGKGWRGEHTARIEWTPGKVRYFIDGALLREVVPTTQVGLTGQGSKTANVGVPSNDHRWTIQVTDNTGNATAKAGHLLIKNYSKYSYNG